MAIPSPGSNDAVFPILLASSGDAQRDITQTFLTQTLSLGSIFRNATNRIFFFGAFPGPLGGPSGEIGQLATHNFIFVDCVNSFFDTAAANRVGYNQTVDIVQYMGFTTRFLAGFVGNSIFTDPNANFAGVVISADASNEFSFEVIIARTYVAENTFGFTQTLTTVALVDAYTQFGLEAVADIDGMEFERAPTQTFLRQHVAYRILGQACPEKEYTPFIGSSGDDSYPAISPTPPVLGSATLTLTHPRASPTLTLVLKNPDFGNSDVLRFTKIDRRTRGGDRKLFSDLGWGQTQSFELEIVNVCEESTPIDDILDFLNTSLGEEIGLLDWENRQWKGIIVAPETDITPQVGGHTVRIVFEGELV